MSNYQSLNQFVDQAFGEVIASTSDITKKEQKNTEDRYEIRLAKNRGGQAKLVLKKKESGRPVPVLTVNAISDTGKNLLYRDQRIDHPDEVVRNLEEALKAVVENLEAG